MSQPPMPSGPPRQPHPLPQQQWPHQQWPEGMPPTARSADTDTDQLQSHLGWITN